MWDFITFYSDYKLQIMILELFFFLHTQQSGNHVIKRPVLCTFPNYDTCPNGSLLAIMLFLFLTNCCNNNYEVRWGSHMIKPYD